MEFAQALQRKDLTLFGTINFQRLDQNFFSPTASEDEANSFSIHTTIYNLTLPDTNQFVSVARKENLPKQNNTQVWT